MASMTYLVSIYMALIIVGNLLFPANWVGISAAFISLYNNPVEALTNLLINAFTNGQLLTFVATVLGTAAVATVAVILGGGGAAILFAIPAILVLTIVNLFALPTQIIFSSAMPTEIKFIVMMVLGALNLVTIWTYTSGRN
jgi:hypothetical protein